MVKTCCEVYCIYAPHKKNKKKTKKSAKHSGGVTDTFQIVRYRQEARSCAQLLLMYYVRNVSVKSCTQRYQFQICANSKESEKNMFWFLFVFDFFSYLPIGSAFYSCSPIDINWRDCVHNKAEGNTIMTYVWHKNCDIIARKLDSHIAICKADFWWWPHSGFSLFLHTALCIFDLPRSPASLSLSQPPLTHDLVATATHSSVHRRVPMHAPSHYSSNWKIAWNHQICIFQWKMHIARWKEKKNSNKKKSKQ